MAYVTITKGKTERIRFIPEGIVETIESTEGIVYIYSTAAGKVAGIGYTGAAGKSSFHYCFRTLEKAQQHGNSFIADLAAAKRRQDERKAATSAPHSLQIGSVVYNSWGYDQTNIDWYKVVGVTPNFVKLQRIPGKSVLDSDVLLQPGMGAMSGMTTPDLDAEPHGEVSLHKVSYGTRINFRHGGGSIWDGEPKYESWYA